MRQKQDPQGSAELTTCLLQRPNAPPARACSGFPRPPRRSTRRRPGGSTRSRLLGVPRQPRRSNGRRPGGSNRSLPLGCCAAPRGRLRQQRRPRRNVSGLAGDRRNEFPDFATFPKQYARVSRIRGYIPPFCTSLDLIDHEFGSSALRLIVRRAFSSCYSVALGCRC